MEDILFEDLMKKIEDEKYKVVYVGGTETSYDYFQVEVRLDKDKSYRVLDTRNSRCSDMVFTDTSHSKNHAEGIMEQLGGGKLTYTFNHNPSTWDEDIGEFDGYYGDGLDHIEELYYMD